MNDDPTEDQRRQVEQAIEALSRGPTEEQARQGLTEQVQRAIKEAHERHWIRYEEAIKLIRGHFNCPEGAAIQKLREAETSGTVQFYRPGPPDYIEDEAAALYCEADLQYWLTQIAAPERIEPVTAEPAQPQQQTPVEELAKRRGPKRGTIKRYDARIENSFLRFVVSWTKERPGRQPRRAWQTPGASPE
jgi:hypothetical protein